MEKPKTRRLLVTHGENLCHIVKVVGLSALMAAGMTIGAGGVLMWTAGVIITWKDITSGHFADTVTCLAILGVSLLMLGFGLAARRTLDIEESVEFVTQQSLLHLPPEETLVRASTPPVETQDELLRATAHNPTSEFS